MKLSFVKTRRITVKELLLWNMQVRKGSFEGQWYYVGELGGEC